MRRRPCPSGPELIAYQDDDLNEDRRAEIDAHLLDCYECRERLWTSEEIGRILRAHIQPIDDPAGREALKRRLAEMPLSQSPPTPPRRWRSLTATTLALLAIVAVGLGWSTGVVESGSSFTRWWRDERSSAQVVPSDREVTTPVSASTVRVGATDLPLGLFQVEGGRTSETSVERFYRNVDGLAIRVAIDENDAWVTPSDDSEDRKIVGIDGRDVLVVYGASHEELMGLFWVDGDALYSVFVLEQSSEGFRIEDAEVLIPALAGAR